MIYKEVSMAKKKVPIEQKERETQEFVRRVLTSSLGQHPSEKTIESVALKVLKALPKMLRLGPCQS
jgi:hypothetical protein